MYITNATSQWSFALSTLSAGLCALIFFGSFGGFQAQFSISTMADNLQSEIQISASKSHKEFIYWHSKAKHVWAFCGSNISFKSSIYFLEKSKKKMQH